MFTCKYSFFRQTKLCFRSSSEESVNSSSGSWHSK